MVEALEAIAWTACRLEESAHALMSLGVAPVARSVTAMEGGASPEGGQPDGCSQLPSIEEDPDGGVVTSDANGDADRLAENDQADEASPGETSSARRPVRQHVLAGTKWLVGATVAAVLGFYVTQPLTDDAAPPDGPPVGKSESPRTPVEPAGSRDRPGFGPPRAAFRCVAPTNCEGPKYVVLNSYINNPQALVPHFSRAISPPIRRTVSEPVRDRWSC